MIKAKLFKIYFEMLLMMTTSLSFAQEVYPIRIERPNPMIPYTVNTKRNGVLYKTETQYLNEAKTIRRLSFYKNGTLESWDYINEEFPGQDYSCGYWIEGFSAKDTHSIPVCWKGDGSPGKITKKSFPKNWLKKNIQVGKQLESLYIFCPKNRFHEKDFPRITLPNYPEALKGRGSRLDIHCFLEQKNQK